MNAQPESADPTSAVGPVMLVPAVPGAADLAAEDGEWSRDDPRWDDPGATLALGHEGKRALLAPPAPPPAPGWKRAAVGLGVAVCVAVVVLGLATTDARTGRGPGTDADTSTTVAPSLAARVVPTMTTVVPTHSYRRAEGVLTMGDGTRYQVGEPGDILVVGDWDCRGDATPGLYRPGTGEVFLFDTWPSGTAVTSRPATATGLTGGDVQVRAGPDGCDVVTLTLP